MRITADIIDEESSNVTKQFPTRTPEIRIFSVSQHTQAVNELTQKFKDLDFFDSPSSSLSQQLKTYQPSIAAESNEQNLGDHKELPKMEDSPPPWFQHYMAKMKHEIKKELLDELLNISPELRQAHVPENQSSKSTISAKEENQLQYQGEVVHSGIYCDNCDQLIHGIRYKCGNCSDFDLCQECESLPNVHNKNHIFLKIRYPFALKMYQKQKWQELMSPLSVKPTRYSDSAYSKSQSKKLYEAKFLCDETVPDSTVIPPSTCFVKSWKVMNSGTRVWTHATKLHLIQGSADLIPSSEQVDVPHLKPGEEGIVSVLFTSPSTPGVYRSHWNFCHKSRPFGHIVWCHIIVKPAHEDVENEVSVQSEINELSDKIVNKHVEVSNIAKVLTAVTEEREEDNMVPRKLVVNSHTTTPNNTPFALTPPKSPDHETLSKSVCEMVHEKAFLTQSNDSDNEDDECSIVSVSSTDSDTEFVVIPMPKCFNLSESFVSQHLRMPHNFMEAAGNSVISNTSVTKENFIQNAFKKSSATSKTVSQETGVPELSEIICEPLHTTADNQKTIQTFHTAHGGSSSEISVIDSGSSSPTVENATQTFDAIKVNITTNSSLNSSEIERIELHLIDAPSEVNSTTSNPEVESRRGNQEKADDIPCNATFPKFPVEGVTSDIYERPSNNLNNPEERTIQVLPEGLVIGALSAAASVYNTARAVISTIQQPRTESIDGISQSPSQRALNVQRDNFRINRSEHLNPMEQLIEMGFCNRQQNETLLKKHNGDVALVVAELVSLSDNDWYASRHIPSSPPGFLD